MADNLVVFNSFNVDPVYRVTRRFPTQRELRQFDVVLPEQLGVGDFQTLTGREYIVIEGKMYPATETSYHNGRQVLRKLANLALEQADSLANRGYVPLAFNANVPQRIMVKALYVDLEENVKFGLVQPFRILCKVAYPVIESQTAKSVTVSTQTQQNIGGLQIPATIPAQISSAAASSTSVLPAVLPIIFGGSLVSNSGTATNAGDFPAYPTITITGPIATPRLTNSSTGEYIQLNLNLASSSDAVILNYGPTSPISVTFNGANAYGALTVGSTLFKIYSGANVLTLSGASIGTGANATVNFFDTWPLS